MTQSVYENRDSVQLMIQEVAEVSDSIQLMLQAKIIWFWIDPWFNSEAWKSALYGPSLRVSWSSHLQIDKAAHTEYCFVDDSSLSGAISLNFEGPVRCVIYLRLIR